MRINNEYKKVVGFLRQAQLVTTYGSGAIVELPNDSVVLAGTDYWKNVSDPKYQIHEENLENILGMDFFLKPKVEAKNDKNIFGISRDIPAFRFPERFICGDSSCQKIYSYKDCINSSKIKCPFCGSESKRISRFIVVCENGHMEDFPYNWWVHRGNIMDCISEKEKLRFFYSKETGGLDNIIIKCENCGKARSMIGSFTKDILKGYKCSGRRPWLNDNEEIECGKVLQTLQRGSNAVYFGVHESALSIPPWSSKVNIELNKIWNTVKGFNLKDPNVFNTFFKEHRILDLCNCNIEELHEQVLRKIDKSSNKNFEHHQLFEDEYKAFKKGINDDLSFKTTMEEIPASLKGYISNIILAYRLREVLVLKGFSRIRPIDNDKSSSFIKLSRKIQNWLPGIELNGEGIFIELNNEAVSRWEKSSFVKQRCSMLLNNMANSFYKIKNLTPRYLLLHTIAHIFIRQLSIYCGYSTASIKERIYSTFSNPNSKEMSGFLIYTATPDSEGSLGGLVDKGKKEVIDNIFKLMLNEANWCSSDPLCIQSGGQGMNNLNLAACHACTLLPETSCESRNCFLDRALVVGTLDNREMGFFSKLL